jgi:hypothetical protein
MSAPNLYWARQLKEWDMSTRGPLGIWLCAGRWDMRGYSYVDA